MPRVVIYTDSSYNDKHRVAGIGCVIIEGQSRKILSNYQKLSSNNEGELFAIWFALLTCPNKEVTLYTDSQSAINYINGNYPKNNPHRPLTLEQKENRARLKIWSYKIRQLLKNNPSFRVEHIKAHTNRYQFHYMQNQMADLLAKEGVAKYFATLQNTIQIHKNNIKSK